MDFRDVNKHLYISCYDFTEIADLKRLAQYDKYAVDGGLGLCPNLAGK